MKIKEQFHYWCYNNVNVFNNTTEWDVHYMSCLWVNKTHIFLILLNYLLLWDLDISYYFTVNCGISHAYINQYTLPLYVRHMPLKVTWLHQCCPVLQSGKRQMRLLTYNTVESCYSKHTQCLTWTSLRCNVCEWKWSKTGLCCITVTLYV